MRLLLFFLLCCAVLPANAVTVVDNAGQKVTLDSPPVRIVSFAPHITEILFELGVGDRIVATVDYSDHPEAAKKIPRLGSAFSVSVESVVALEPDIVFAWATGGNQKAVAQIRALGIPVYTNEAGTLSGVADSLLRIGLLVGAAKQGEQLAAEFKQGLIEIAAAKPTQKKSVFFQISDAQLYTVNHEHLIGQGLALCHADNIFGSLPIPVPIVSYESVVAADPQVIVVSVPDPDYVSPWEARWQSLGWEGRIRRIEASLITRPSFRMLEGLKILCQNVNG